MSIHILNTKNANNSNAEASLHSIPCKIHADSEASLKKYFEPYIKTTENGDMESSFRGYKLNGDKLSLPEGYKGVILHENIKPVSGKQERKFYVTNNFENINYWNWDKKTSKNDAIAQAMDWIDIAEILHSPIVEE